MKRRTGDWGRGDGRMRHGSRLVVIVLLVVGAASFAACASSPPPEPAPAPEPPAPVLRVLAPAAAAGNYRLRTEIQRQGGPPRRGRTPAETPLVLTSTPAAAPQVGGPSTTFNATVQIPGYTRAPRGRTGQASAWWPIPGDSVVLQFAAQQGDLVQLRGKLEGTTLRGELWYLSMETGATFQLGTFSAVKR